MNQKLDKNGKRINTKKNTTNFSRIISNNNLDLKNNEKNKRIRINAGTIINIEFNNLMSSKYSSKTSNGNITKEKKSIEKKVKEKRKENVKNKNKEINDDNIRIKQNK